jgi:hypothetical protein
LDARFERVQAGGAADGELGFEEGSAAGGVAVTTSEGFRVRADETVESLVAEAGKVVATVAETLTKLAEKVGSAELTKVLQGLGKQVAELPRIGVLFRKGLEKLQRAIGALLRFVGSDVLEKARDSVQHVWKEITEGKHVDRALTWAFGAEETRRHVAAVLAAATPTAPALEMAGGELAELNRRFGEVMGVGRLLAGAIGLGATVALLTPLGVQGALAAASLNVLLLGTVIVIGTDYTDASRVFRSVRGVREIASGLRDG